MEELDKIAFMIFFADQIQDDTMNYYTQGYEMTEFCDIFEYSFKYWKNEYMTEKDADHRGDCINVPCTCMRCVIDDYYKQAQKYLEKMNE